MINLKTPKERIKEWQTQNNMRAGFEVKLASAISKEINRVAKQVSVSFITAGKSAIGIHTREHHSKIKNIIFTHWRAVTTVFRDRTLSMLRTVVSAERKEYEDEFDRLFDEFLFTFGAEKVNNISAKTMADIITAIESARLDELDVYQTAKRITELTAISSLTRAVLIARTETHQAANYANFTSLDVVNIPNITKQWVAINDARTRDDHAIADGQEVAKDGKFIVGGAELMHPGDPSGPPEQVINCRCTFVVNVPEPDFGGEG